MENPFETIQRTLDAMFLEIKKQGQAKATSTPQKQWGDITFASEITGYKQATIYIKVGRNEIPFIKRDGKLWFEKTALLKWIETGIIEKLDRQN